MPEIVMYTTGICPYCVRAKMLLQRKGLDWEEKRIDLDDTLAAEMMRRSNRRTAPQVVVGERCIGGYDDLARLDATGELDAMLGLSATSLPGDSTHTYDAS